VTAARLVLRADASHRLGSGHALRLAALAEAALDAGGAATLVLGDEPARVVGTVRGARPARGRRHRQRQPADAAATIALARARGVDAVSSTGPRSRRRTSRRWRRPGCGRSPSTISASRRPRPR
jgi:hypothetical protein